MSRRQTVSYLIERFREAGIRPDTRHGQNFLIDLNLLSLLARSAQLSRKDVVLEVGTGLGALTGLLAPQAGAVVSVELSRELHQLASEELVDFPNVTLLQCDALRNKNHFNSRVLETVNQCIGAVPGRRLKLVANLPYCIATPVVSNLLRAEHPPHSMTVTIQKELADRMTARPRTKAYGALSVWIQSQCEIRMKRVLPPAAFWPRPRVHSAIIQLVVDPTKRGLIPDLSFFSTFLRTVFMHRRKYLRSGLIGAYKNVLGKSKIDDLLRDLEFGPRARAEELGISELLALSEKVRETVSESE